MSKEDSLQSVYLDTSIFAGKVMMADQEDKQCAILLGKISSNEFNQFRFLTSKFTLIEIAELIARKVTGYFGEIGHLFGLKTAGCPAKSATPI